MPSCDTVLLYQQYFLVDILLTACPGFLVFFFTLLWCELHILAVGEIMTMHIIGVYSLTIIFFRTHNLLGNNLRNTWTYPYSSRASNKYQLMENSYTVIEPRNSTKTNFTNNLNCSWMLTCFFPLLMVDDVVLPELYSNLDFWSKFPIQQIKHDYGSSLAPIQ